MILPQLEPHRLLKLSGSIAAALMLGSSTSAFAQKGANQISPAAALQMGQIIQAKHSFTPGEQKLSSNLVFASRLARSMSTGGTDAMIDRTNINDSDGTVLVKISAPVLRAVLDQISTNGGTILQTYPSQNVIMARVPLTALPTIAAGPRVVHIDEPDLCVSNVGAVTSQAYVSHRAKPVVEGLNVNGSNVKVGVLSVSATPARVAALIASGDLPANTVVLPGQASSGSAANDDDEGTAMMEIIHDLAPGSQLYFATGFTGVPQFVANIQALNAAGCTVIVDDITYFNEGAFQDGPIAQAVNAFVATGGIYFSSAANSGNIDAGTGGTWEGDFVSGGAVALPISDGTSALVHNFGATGTTALYDTLTVATTAITLKWSDPLGASTDDYDLFVLNSTGTTVLGSAVTRQTGTSDPYEIVSNSNGFPVGSRVVIVQYNNGVTPSATRALHLDTNRGALTISTQGTTYGHNAGANTQSCAATYWNSAHTGTVPFTGAANPVETFSSDGPRKIFYTPAGLLIGSGAPTFANASAGQTLLKPDFTAADGVVCKTPGFSPFFGTSAAAPHAAAIAALVISAKPTITNTQVHNILVNTTLNNGAPGFDRDGGYGVLDALNAVNAARALP